MDLTWPLVALAVIVGVLSAGATITTSGSEASEKVTVPSWVAVPNSEAALLMMA